MSEAGGTPMGGRPGRRSFGERLIGALKLDASVYEEVEHDPEALGQAAGVVALAALAQGIGSVGMGGLGGFVRGLVAFFVFWAAGTGVVWLIGVKGFGGRSDYPELLRTLGFASAPALLTVIGVLPLGPFRWLLGLVVFALIVVAFVIAVRQALDVDTGKAVIVCVLAAFAWFAILALLMI